MQTFRVAKTKPKSTIPPKSWNLRRLEIADSLESDQGNLAMVACSECVNNNALCYYDREQSVKCAECLRHPSRKCDGTFAMEEFRKVGEQKKMLEAQSLEKGRQLQEVRRKLLQARRALLDVESCFALIESEDLEIRDELAKVKEKSSRMLEREMRALGVFNDLPSNAEVALAEPNFVTGDAPAAESSDWSAVLNFDASDQVAG
jgi:ribosomal protein S27E